MGRRKLHGKGLPIRLYFRRGSYCYGPNSLSLGKDKRAALLKYVELETGKAAVGTFADAADAYRKQELAAKAPKTQEEYGRQLATLVLVFGAMPMPSIKPTHVVAYVRERGKRIRAYREKALLSAVWNFARSEGITDAPNPCQGIRSKKSQRKRYVTDNELTSAMQLAMPDPVLGGFLELCYLTGQRPSDVLRMRRSDVRDGALCVEQRKTGAKVRIDVVGPLAALLQRLMSGGVESRHAPSTSDHGTGTGEDRNAKRTGTNHPGGVRVVRGLPRPAAGVAPGPLTPISSLWLIHDARGQRVQLGTIRARFVALGVDWQIRDLRAKAASDSATAKDAQALLGHSAASTTDGYIRQRVGQRVQPIMREPKK